MSLWWVTRLTSHKLLASVLGVGSTLLLAGNNLAPVGPGQVGLDAVPAAPLSALTGAGSTSHNEDVATTTQPAINHGTTEPSLASTPASKTPTTGREALSPARHVDLPALGSSSSTTTSSVTTVQTSPPVTTSFRVNLSRATVTYSVSGFWAGTEYQEHVPFTIDRLNGQSAPIYIDALGDYGNIQYSGLIVASAEDTFGYHTDTDPMYNNILVYPKSPDIPHVGTYTARIYASDQRTSYVTDLAINVIP